MTACAARATSVLCARLLLAPRSPLDGRLPFCVLTHLEERTLPHLADGHLSHVDGKLDLARASPALARRLLGPREQPAAARRSALAAEQHNPERREQRERRGVKRRAAGELVAGVCVFDRGGMNNKCV